MNSLFLCLTARRLAAAVIGVAALQLGGCAVNTSVADPLKLTAQSTDLPVAVSITANTDEISGFNTIKLRRMAEGEKPGGVKLLAEHLVMRRVAPGMARDTSLFIGALQPGEYEFVELIDTSSNKLLRVYSSGMVGTFKVESGKATDLGRLIVTRANFSVDFGRSAHDVSNAELINRFAPEYSKMFGAGASPGWSGPRSERDKVEEFARAHPFGAQCAAELPDGRVAAASRMGAVLLRSKQGRWSTLNAQQTETLSCVLPVTLPDAELIAVGEFSTLLRKAPGSDSLVPIDAGNLPPGNLLRIGGNPKDGWYLMHWKGRDLTIFRARQLEGGDWQAVHKVVLPGSLSRSDAVFWPWHDARGMGFSLPDGRMGQLDYDTGKWIERKPPGKAKLAAFLHAHDGTESILVAAGLLGKFPDPYFSRDRGQSWTLMVSPLKVLVSPVIPLNDGRMLMTGQVYGKRELLASSDDGKTWASYADYNFSGGPAMLPSGLMLDIQSSHQGVVTIRSSADSGKTWLQEYSTFDLDSVLKQLAK
ncbi:sialidase family protein [Rugamonas rivuli]|uniref:Exo-alpha-sialidase n=1 Tax=Rugamonas rivuli TaxID=2743358 RepID=A0A843S519_9BURK|nr:sialidase family protein [Rugamonas rivuli]MQA19219.1 hypothetical protein [Rugamonas rivuli]